MVEVDHSNSFPTTPRPRTLFSWRSCNELLVLPGSLDLSGYVEKDEESERNAGDEDGKTGGERRDDNHAPLLQASNISLSGYSGEEVVELCYQSVEVFIAVRDKVLHRNTPPSDYSQSWVDLSFRYRKLMRECANAVRRRADDIAAGGFEANLEVEAVVATLDFLGKVWHLVEIVHMDACPLLARAIARWLREHFGGRALSIRLTEGEHRCTMESKLTLGENTDFHQSSWYKELLIELVIWGRLRRAGAAIRIRPDYVEGDPANPPFIMFELLNEFPSLSLGGTKGARRAFQNDFLRWRRRCESCEPVVLRDESLHQIMDVLLGKEDVILRESNGSWSAMMSAHLLYVYPTATSRDIRALADQCLSAGDSACAVQDSSAAAQAKVDHMVLDIMCGEPGEAVNLLARAGDDISAVGALAHFVHLLHSCGVLSEDMMPLPSRADCTSGGDLPLPELLLVNLSEKLFSLPRGRDIAVQYLSSCPRAGEEALRALIQHVQPQSEKETECLVMWCRRGGLEEEADTFCRTRARYWMLWGTSNYGAVAYWLIRARDGTFLGKVCSKLSNALMDVVESVFWERKEKWYPNDKIADTTISSFAMTGSPLTQVAVEIMRSIDGVSQAVPDRSALQLSSELEFLLGYKRLVEALDFSAPSCVALNGDSREVATRLEQLLADIGTTPMRAWPNLMKLAHLLLRVDGSAISSKQLLTILNRLHELELSYKCEEFSVRNDSSSTDDSIWWPGKKGGEPQGGSSGSGSWYGEVKSTLASGLTAALMKESKQRKAAAPTLPSTHTSLETSAFELLVGSLE